MHQAECDGPDNAPAAPVAPVAPVAPRTSSMPRRCGRASFATVLPARAYYAFPDIHWHKIRTNNPLERIMREIRRRTRVVGAFPDGQSCLNLAAARLRYIAGTAWSAKCYMNMRPLYQPQVVQTEAAAYFAKEFNVKFSFIAKHRGIWAVDWMCEALGVSRGGFYAWLTRPRSRRSRDNDELGAKVRASFLASDRTYGARRVWRDLLEEGLSCGLHRIERLMRSQALKARPRRRRLPPDAGERQAGAVAPNVLDRTFEAAAPNRKWIADFTYVWTAEGWLYVAAVIDLFSRRVVGWSMSAAMTAQLVTDALVMAIWRRGRPDALLHHSDRGSQYTSEQFQRLMADNGVVCSMSRSGNVWDNAAMESFFSSLKTERTGNKTYRTRDEARMDVFDYIERFYNSKRRHSTIGYLSPMEFERKAGFA